MEGLIMIPLITIIAVAAGLLALVDGIIRVRGRGTAILAIIEIIFAVLFLILFIPQLAAIITTPLAGTTIAIILLIVLILQLVLRGSTRRAGAALTVVAIILLVIWLIVHFGWVVIPGLS
jgi:hypothetical protein